MRIFEHDRIVKVGVGSGAARSVTRRDFERIIRPSRQMIARHVWSIELQLVLQCDMNASSVLLVEMVRFVRQSSKRQFDVRMSVGPPHESVGLLG